MPWPDFSYIAPGLCLSNIHSQTGRIQYEILENLSELSEFNIRVQFKLNPKYNAILQYV